MPVMPVESEDAGCEPVPADLVELHEVLEWNAALEVDQAPEQEGPDRGKA